MFLLGLLLVYGDELFLVNVDGVRGDTVNSSCGIRALTLLGAVSMASVNVIDCEKSDKRHAFMLFCVPFLWYKRIWKIPLFIISFENCPLYDSRIFLSLVDVRLS